MKLFQKIFNNTGFKCAELAETLYPLNNPCRGWCRLYYYMPEEEPDYSQLDAVCSHEDSVVLLIIDIGAVAKSRPEPEQLDRMKAVVKYLRAKGKDIILRIVYDHEGHALEREPVFFSNVQEHAKIIAQLLRELSGELFIYQGLLVGNWGEMHSSRFVDEDKLRGLEQLLKKGCGNETFMAVRKPVQWRRIRRIRYDGSDPQPDGLGLFNDGMFGSETDLGTYNVRGDRAELGWSQAWGREAEIAFQNHICRWVPNGGEALYDEAAFNKNMLPDYINELTRMHITYLNHEHDRRLLEYWRQKKIVSKGIWNDETLYDYIGAHLGYRFIVRSAELKKRGNGECELLITIENTGFANIYRACRVEIDYQGPEGPECCVPDFDLRDCESGTRSVVRGIITPQGGAVYLSARQSADGRTIHFANTETADGRICVGHFEK